MEQFKLLLGRIKDSNETTPSTTSIGVARSEHKDVMGICRINKIKDETASNLHVHVSLPATTTLWTPPLQCGRRPTTRRKKNIGKPGSASSVANRDTSRASAPQRKTGRCRTAALLKQRTTKPIMTSPTSASTQKHWQLKQCGCRTKIKTLSCVSSEI